MKYKLNAWSKSHYCNALIEVLSTEKGPCVGFCCHLVISRWLCTPMMFWVLPDLTDRTPVARSGTPDLNWPDHNLLPTTPLPNLTQWPVSLICPSFALIIADQAEMPNSGKVPRKYSSKERGASHIRRFLNLGRISPFRLRSSKWSRLMQIIPPPPRSSFSVRFGGPIAPLRWCSAGMVAQEDSPDNNNCLQDGGSKLRQIGAEWPGRLLSVGKRGSEKL